MARKCAVFKDAREIQGLFSGLERDMWVVYVRGRDKHITPIYGIFSAKCQTTLTSCSKVQIFSYMYIVHIRNNYYICAPTASVLDRLVQMESDSNELKRCLLKLYLLFCSCGQCCVSHVWHAQE